MQEFDFYKSKEVYREKYYQLPKVLFSNPKYKSMSLDAKVAYAFLKDRFNYSIQNNWVDENDNIYFVYTVEELKEILQCAEGKVSKLKKELIAAGLLFQTRGGFTKVNGVQKNLPNRLYLGKLEVNANDVFSISNLENNGTAKIANPQEAIFENIPDGIAKIANPQEASNTNVFNGIAKIADNLLDSPLDSLKTDTLKTDTEKENLLQTELLSTFHQTVTETFLSESSLKFIAMFSKTIQEAQDKLAIIYRAKKKAEKETSEIIIGEDYQQEIDINLRRVIQKIKTDHKIKKPNSYMFNSFYYFFLDCIKAKQQPDLDLPKITLLNLDD